jgi:hypothetical protein
LLRIEKKNFWGRKKMAEKFHSLKMDSGWTFIRRIELLGTNQANSRGVKTYTTHRSNNTIRPNPQTGNTAKNQNTHNPPIKQQINTKLPIKRISVQHRKSTGNRPETASKPPEIAPLVSPALTHQRGETTMHHAKSKRLAWQRGESGSALSLGGSTQKMHMKSAGNHRRSRLWFRRR